MAGEVAENNITVNNIATGYFLTDRVNKRYGIDEKLKQGMSEKEAVGNRGIPMKRFGTTEEVAYMVAFLASKEATYITGSNFDVAGGL